MLAFASTIGLLALSVFVGLLSLILQLLDCLFAFLLFLAVETQVYRNCLHWFLGAILSAISLKTGAVSYLVALSDEQVYH